MVFVADMLPKFEESAVREVPAHAEPRDAAAGALGPKLLAWWGYRGDIGEM